MMHHFFVVVVFPELTSDGVDDGFTAVLGCEPRLCWSEVTCHVFGNGSRQGFRCETSKSLSHGHRRVTSVLPSQGSERGPGNPVTTGARNVAFGHDADIAPARLCTLEGWSCLLSPAQRKGGRPGQRRAKGLWRGRPAQSGGASLWPRRLLEVAGDGLEPLWQLFRSGEPVVHPAGRNRPLKGGLLSPGSWPESLAASCGFVALSSDSATVRFWEFVVARVILGRPRATVRTFVACRWRIVCCSVCHPSTSEDQFRKAYEIGPGLGVAVRCDSWHGSHKAKSPSFQGCHWDLRSEWDREEGTLFRCGEW